VLQPCNDFLQPFAAHQIREHKGTLAALPPRVAIHHFERRPHVRREVDLVNHQQPAALDAGSTLARNLVAARDVDHVNKSIHEFGAEGRREVVAAAFDEDQLHPWVEQLKLGNRLQVHRSVLANGRVRATAGLDAHDAVGGQRALADQELGVLLGVDVVGDDAHIHARPKPLAQAIHQGRLSATHRTRDSNSKCPHVILLRTKSIVARAAAPQLVRKSTILRQPAPRRSPDRPLSWASPNCESCRVCRWTGNS
jgi:hypothetical protein